MRKIIAIAGIVGLSLCWAVMPAGAGNSPHFDSTPTSGPPGTVIHASDPDFNCDSTGANVHVEVIGQDENTIAEADTTVGADATWAVDVTIPSDATPGEYAVTASCSGDETRVFYADNSFTVTAVVETTTTTAPAPTTTTTVKVVPQATTTTTTVAPVPVAPAATPVVASPALTG